MGMVQNRYNLLEQAVAKALGGSRQLVFEVSSSSGDGTSGHQNSRANSNNENGNCPICSSATATICLASSPAFKSEQAPSQTK